MTTFSNRIVAGIDGSAESGLALAWAADEALRRSCPLVGVHAWTLPSLRDHKLGELLRPDPYRTEAQAKRMVDDLVAAERDRHPGLDITADAREGHPVQRLIASSSDAGLVVVGARGVGGFHRLLLGSVSGGLILHANCPVVIVRAPGEDHRDGSSGRIVVGIDGSESAGEALAWAIAEAQLRKARLEVVMSWTYPWVYVGVDGAIPPIALQDQTPDMEATMKTILDSHRIDLAGLQVVPIVREGAAASVLLDVARGADLLVVGSRGRGGFAGTLLGSVSRQIAHHASGPVAIIRGSKP